jgi:glutamate-1-semialdehyde aminotransferase
VGPIVSVFVTKRPVEKLTNYRAVREHCDFEKYIAIQHQSQNRGVYYHPNQFETMFLSTAHTSEHIATALERIEDGARHCLTA